MAYALGHFAAAFARICSLPVKAIRQAVRQMAINDEPAGVLPDAGVVGNTAVWTGSSGPVAPAFDRDVRGLLQTLSHHRARLPG